jgi:hypothetical protein
MSKSRYNGRKMMLRQLGLYRGFVSQNDCRLYWQYTKFIEGCFSELPKDDYLYRHASLFREFLYVDAYNTAYSYLTTGYERGCHYYSTGKFKVEVNFWLDGFSVVFVP